MREIIKSLVVGAAFLYSSASFANSGMPCQKIEYAQLKDSTREELNSEYRSAMARAELNGKLKALTTVPVEITERGDAQVSCLRSAEDVRAMLKKKFKAQPPNVN